MQVRYSYEQKKLNNSINFNFLRPILDCIHALQLVDKCQYLKMYTPAIWIINVFEILQENNFCKSIILFVSNFFKLFIYL